MDNTTTTNKETTTMNQPTYEVCVTATFGTDLRPRYEFFIYQQRTAGVCGPLTESRTVYSMDEVETIVAIQGFERVESYTEFGTGWRATIRKAA